MPPRPSTPAVRLAPHRHVPMTGRDAGEEHRVATPLELLFDLTFVVAFGFAGSELAHAVADGHAGGGVLAYGFVMFAVNWAWINFTWFASGFDTDDWFYRVTTMVQMVGVLILALGIHDVFASVVEGDHLDNRVLVLGYVVMRVAMVVQWLRAARQSPTYAATCRAYALGIVVAQVGWVLVAVLDLSLPVTVACGAVLWVVEMAGPAVAERRVATPWHPHHVSERYGLLAIITLGEGIVGSVAALAAVVETQGWTWQTALVGLAGVGLTFGIWWNYFMLPAAEVLEAYGNRRAFVWGYGHMVLFAAIASVGAGLEVAALQIESEHAAHGEEGGHALSAVTAALAVAVPVALFTAMLFFLYWWLTRSLDRLHVGLLLGEAAFLAGGVLLAVLHVPLPVCLLMMCGAPLVTVVGYERAGHAIREEAVARTVAAAR